MPPMPPLLKGGQGRDDSDLEAEAQAILTVLIPALAFATAFVLGFLMGKGMP